MRMYKSTVARDSDRFSVCFDQPEAVTNVAPCLTFVRYDPKHTHLQKPGKPGFCVPGYWLSLLKDPVRR